MFSQVFVLAISVFTVWITFFCSAIFKFNKTCAGKLCRNGLQKMLAKEILQKIKNVSNNAYTSWMTAITYAHEWAKASNTDEFDLN